MAKIIEISAEPEMQSVKIALERNGHEVIQLPNVSAWIEYWTRLELDQKAKIDGVIIRERVDSHFPKKDDDKNVHDFAAADLLKGKDNYRRAAYVAKFIFDGFKGDGLTPAAFLIIHGGNNKEQRFAQLKRLADKSGAKIIDTSSKRFMSEVVDFAANALQSKKDFAEKWLNR